MSGFVALHRNDTAQALLEKHPTAFLLLTQIAMRARWKNEPCPVTGLKKNEAFIGDFRAAGLRSEKAYRNAKEQLKRVGLCGFRRATQGAKRGTIAILLNEEIFSISQDEGAEQRAVEGRSGGGARATKNKETKKQGNTHPPSAGASVSNSQKIPTLDQAERYASSAPTTISKECARAWHDDRTSLGWEKPKGNSAHTYPIRNWMADLRSYAANWQSNRQGNPTNGTTKPNHGITHI